MTAFTARLTTAQLVLVVLALITLTLAAGFAVEHLAAAGALGSHPVNPPCKNCH